MKCSQLSRSNFPARGFSLIELLIVVAIIGIISAFAVPAYSGYVQRSKIQEATSSLADLRVKMEQYYQDNRKYVNAGGACGVPLPGSTAPVVPALRYFDVTCPGPTNDTYVLTATGKAAENMGGFQYTVDQNNGRKSTFTAPATGWNTSTTCWVTKKGESC